MSIAQQPLTYLEFERMTFERPTELVRGEIVELEMPGSQHGSVCAIVTAFLVMWARAGKHGSVFSNDSHILVERDPDTVRGPDCAYIRRDRLPGGKLPSGVLEIPPDLAIEVLSPSDRWSEVLDKVLEYLTCGVTEVWVIDPEKRTMSIHQTDRSPIRLGEGDTLADREVLPGFSCAISEFFAEI